MSVEKNRVTILQVPFHGITVQNALDILHSYLLSERNHLVVTPNPEAVMIAQRDKNYLKILQSADLVLADGIGIVLAARWKRGYMPSRVRGCDTTLALINTNKNCSFYFLGAAPGVAETARDKLKKQGFNIVGARDGYFDAETERIIIEEIQALKPDVLLVGMGMPRQEEWAAANLHTLPCKITLCIGGTIDILAGNVKRAPKIMRDLGLEWLYRLVCNPSRAKRMLDLPRFTWAVLTEPKQMFRT